MINVVRKNCSRRNFILAGFTTALSLPLLEPVVSSQVRSPEEQFSQRIRGWDHIGLSVRDQEKSANFYGRVFNPDLHGFKLVPPRFFVTLGDGYIAFGGLGKGRPRIDHFSPLVQDYGESKTVDDADGLSLQLKGTPGGLTENTVPIGRISTDQAVLQPTGFDHLMLVVPNLELSIAHYRQYFGQELSKTAKPNRVWFKVGQSRLGLEQAQDGEAARADHFCVNVARYNRDAVLERLRKLGAEIASGNDEGLLRFRDPDGILVELKEA